LSVIVVLFKDFSTRLSASLEMTAVKQFHPKLEMTAVKQLHPKFEMTTLLSFRANEVSREIFHEIILPNSYMGSS